MATRLFKRLNTGKSKPSNRVNKVLVMHQGRKSYQVKRNLARQAMQQAEKDMYRQRLNARRFGLARPVGPGF